MSCREREDQEVGYRLFPWVESVKEALRGHNWALVDESSTVDVIVMCLKYTMPVLQTISDLLPQRLRYERRLRWKSPSPWLSRSIDPRR